MSLVAKKLPHQQSVLLSKRRVPLSHMKIPEYNNRKKEYLRRDFSPYIKRFLQ